MEQEDGQERTEDPTAKRIEDFQKQGQFGQSREIASVGILFTGLLFLYYGLQSLMSGTMAFMIGIFRGLDRPLNGHTVGALLDQARDEIGLSLLQMLLVLALAGAVAAYAQVGWHPNSEALEMKLERLNPLPGVKRLFSKEALIELAKSLFKLGIVIAIGYQMLRGEIGQIVQMPRSGLHNSVRMIGDLLYRFSLRCLMWLLVVAVLDMAWQRYSLWQRMKMTRQEIKEESKEKEGNPQIKAQMRRKARQRMQKSGIQNVPKADVVVTNPDHYAIALQYVSGKMRAPVVVARGQDRIAELIKAEARKHGIPRVENRNLARTLYKLSKVGDEIPPEVYAAVAEVLAFVYRLKQQNLSAS